LGPWARHIDAPAPVCPPSCACRQPDPVKRTRTPVPRPRCLQPLPPVPISLGAASFAGPPRCAGRPTVTPEMARRCVETRTGRPPETGRAGDSVHRNLLKHGGRWHTSVG
jgi:hypothetical protein